MAREVKKSAQVQRYHSHLFDDREALHKMKRTQASIDKMIATRKRNKVAARARDVAWINGHEHQQHAHQQYTQQQQMTPKPEQPPKPQHLRH